MARRARLSPDDARDRILAEAEDLFRRVGYVKTTVADIAAAAGMSPANVYRFFASKTEINEALCTRLMGAKLALAAAIVAEPAPAGQRLERLILALHRQHRQDLVGERQVHEMVEAAMAESWDAIHAYISEVVAQIARLLREGCAAGEFRPTDPEATAETIKCCLMGVLHPRLIAEQIDADLEARTLALARFIHQALAAGPAGVLHAPAGAPASPSPLPQPLPPVA